MFAGGWLNGWNFFTDLHPKTKQQYDYQRGLGGLFPGYAQWMKGRAQDEINNQTMADLGLSWNDIKSPWASSLAGGSGSSALGNITRSMSSNVTRLYAKEKRASDKRARERDLARQRAERANRPRTARQDFHRLGPRYYRLGNEILAYYNPKRL